MTPKLHDVMTKPCEPLDLCRRVAALLQMAPDRPHRDPAPLRRKAG